MTDGDVVKSALFECVPEDDVLLNIFVYKHEEWLQRNPEYTQSPYSAVIAELQGQLPLLEESIAKHMRN